MAKQPKPARIHHKVGPHLLTGLKTEMGWQLWCASFKDIPERFNGCTDASEAIDEFERRATEGAQDGKPKVPTLFDGLEDDAFDPPVSQHLDEQRAIPSHTMARTTDDATSHAAAEEVTASGIAADQRRRVLAAVVAQPGLTSDEIAQAAGMQRHQPARRLSELERLGLVRRGEARPSRVTGRAGLTWYAVEANSAEVA